MCHQSSLLFPARVRVPAGLVNARRVQDTGIGRGKRRRVLDALRPWLHIAGMGTGKSIGIHHWFYFGLAFP